jgi:hypothetical protein
MKLAVLLAATTVGLTTATEPLHRHLLATSSPVATSTPAPASSGSPAPSPGSYGSYDYSYGSFGWYGPGSYGSYDYSYGSYGSFGFPAFSYAENDQGCCFGLPDTLEMAITCYMPHICGDASWPTLTPTFKPTYAPTFKPTASPTRYPTPLPTLVTCMNGLQDSTEADVDCGGGSCPRCNVGLACTEDDDCSSSACVSSICVESPTPAPTQMPTQMPTPAPTPAPTRTPIVSVTMIMSGLQCDAFNATVFRLALDTVVSNGTFSDEVCTDVDSNRISISNEVTVPLFMVAKFEVLNIHEYVTNVLNESVAEGTLTISIRSFATEFGQRRLDEHGRRLDATGMSSAEAESVSVATFSPTPAPSGLPTPMPSAMPTPTPTPMPTTAPSFAPSSSAPSSVPIPAPVPTAAASATPNDGSGAKGSNGGATAVVITLVVLLIVGGGVAGILYMNKTPKEAVPQEEEQMVVVTTQGIELQYAPPQTSVEGTDNDLGEGAPSAPEDAESAM